MADVHVRDVPESVVAAIRERAARHGHSMQQEIREILAKAAADPVPGTTPEPVRLITVRSGVTSRWNREEIYGDACR